MADIQFTLTNAGEAYIATQIAARQPIILDSWQIGTGTSTASLATRTALQTPYSPPKTFTIGAGLQAENVVQFVLLDTDRGTGTGYTASEIGVFAGTTLVFYAVTPVTKPDDARFEHTQAITLTGATLDPATFTFPAPPAAPLGTEAAPGIWAAATNAEVNAGTSTTKVVRPSSLGGWLARQLSSINIDASRLTSGTIPLARLPSQGFVTLAQATQIAITQARTRFTDALLTKLNGIETGATRDQSGAEIRAALDSDLGTGWRMPAPTTRHAVLTSTVSRGTNGAYLTLASVPAGTYVIEVWLGQTAFFPTPRVTFPSGTTIQPSVAFSASSSGQRAQPSIASGDTVAWTPDSAGASTIARYFNVKFVATTTQTGSVSLVNAAAGTRSLRAGCFIAATPVI